MSKTEDRFRRYEKLRKKVLKDAPPSCRRCPYYQPDFKYRTCTFPKCPFDKDKQSLRRKPLKRNRFS